MLMFNFYIAFSLGLIALAFGAAILIWSKGHESVGTSLAKLIGYIIIIVSVPNLLCNSYWAVKYWFQGSFDKPYPMMMMRDQMMGGKNMQMMQCPMMSGQMMPMQGQKMMSQDGQNQMANGPMTQGAAIEAQKPLLNNQAEQTKHHQ